MSGELVLAVFFLVLPVYFFWPAIWESRLVTWMRFNYFPKGLKKVDFTSAGINPYYSSLSEELRMKFAWRAFYFLDTTDIEFHQLDDLKQADRDRVKLLLAAVAAQMTLFLPEICFKMIHTIIVYPQPYLSTITKQMHKGETNPGAGVVVLTLTGIQEGIKEPYDGLNLILHEYSHALWLEHKLTSYETFDNDAADKFEQIAKQEFERAQSIEGHIFRDYGTTNLIEFIAVATENFFERPWKFRANLHPLYEAMIDLYEQDPSRYLPEPLGRVSV